MKMITFLGVFWVLLIAAGGCLDNDRSLTIIQNLALDEECEVQSGNAGSFLAAGTLDLAYPDFGGFPSYLMTIEVRNALPQIGSCTTGNLNPNDIQLDRMEVSYFFEQGREGLTDNMLLLEQQPLVLPIAGTYLAESAENVLAFIPVIPPQVGSRLYPLGQAAKDVIIGVNVRIIGTTLAGDRVESNDFLFPVYLCWNCLTGAICPDGSFPGCLPGQDGVTGECSDIEEE